MSFNEALPDLTRQQRNLLLLAPLYYLSANVGRLADAQGTRGALEGLDTHYLALRLFDYLIEGAPLHGGRTREECVERLVQHVGEMAPHLPDAQRLSGAEFVLRGLENAQGHYKEFEEGYFNAIAGRHAFFRFRLIQIERNADDEGRLKLTTEGHLAYLGMLDLPADVSEELMQRASQLMLERGRYADALQLIQQARTRSSQFRTELLHNIQRMTRNPRDVKWVEEVEPELSKARLHVEGRRKEDARMLESASLALSDLGPTDAKGADQLRLIRDALDSANTLRVSLFNDLQHARERFFEANARQLTVRKRVSLGHVGQVLEPGLGGLPPQRFAPFVDRALSALFPPRQSRLFDLGTVAEMVARPLSTPAAPEPDAVLPRPDRQEPDETFSPELDAQMRSLVEQVLAHHSPIDLPSVLETPAFRALSHTERSLAVTWLYRQFSSEVTGFCVSNEGRFRTDFMEGSRLVFTKSQD